MVKNKMKKILFGLIIGVISCSSFAESWRGRDKELHFAMGAGVSSLATLAFKDEEVGFWSGVAVGAAKEIYDYKHPKSHDASFKDFAVTALGAFAGAKITGLVVTKNSISYVHKWEW